MLTTKSAESDIDKCTSGNDKDESSNTISERTDDSKMDFILTEKNAAESAKINLMDVDKTKITDQPAIEDRQETSTDVNKSKTLQTKAQEKKTSASSPGKRSKKRNDTSNATPPTVTTRSRSPERKKPETSTRGN